MANILSKLRDIFRKKDTGTASVDGTSGASFNPSGAGVAPASQTPAQTPAGQAFKPATVTVKSPSGKTQTFGVGQKQIGFDEFSQDDSDYHNVDLNTGAQQPTTTQTTTGRSGPDRRPLSERSKENDRANGIDWTGASQEQLDYLETYYRTLDDKEHTKMFQDLERFHWSNPNDTEWGKAFKEQYTANYDALTAELDGIKDQYGKDSYEYRAMKKFIDDYEDLARGVEVRRSRQDSDRYSAQLDENIQGIYGGLMSSPDFQTKADEGLEELKKHPAEYADFKQATENASDDQLNLLYYIRATEGKDGVKRFMASGLGELMLASSASRVYADTIETDSDFLRGAAMFGQQVAEGVTGIVQSGESLYRGITGKDQDDPTDRDLGGGYTISDSTDYYLQSSLAPQLEDAGVTDAQFKYIAELGLADLAEKKWAADMLANASDYQKQVLGFMYAASGKDSVKDLWQTVQQREQAVWGAVKKGSNYVPKDVGDYLADMYTEYARLGGKDLTGLLANVGGGEGATLEQMLLQGARSASEQIVPLLVGGGMGSAFSGLGATQKVASTAGRLASGLSLSTEFGGRAYDEAARMEGVSRGEALGYGITEAGLEFITEYLLGVTGGAVFDPIKGKVASRVASPLLRALSTAGISSWGEGTQEYVQEALEPIVKSIFLHEGELMDAVSGAFDPSNILDPDRLYAGALGVITSLAMSPMSVGIDIRNNRYYSELGTAMGNVDALGKTADIILNADPATMKDTKAFKEAQKMAQRIKNGEKVSSTAAGKMIVDFAEAGGDLSHLKDLGGMGYNKETLTREDYLAGAVSMLQSMDGDVALAEAIVSAAMGEEISQEMQDAIESDSAAVQVLSQLIGPLDMSQDTALSRAAKASTRGVVTGNKVFETLRAENPDKTVATPFSRQLYDKGVAWDEASEISSVLEKVVSGVEITEDEAELVSVSNPVVRALVNESLGIDLAEDSTIGAVMTALNDFARTTTKVKAQQADLKDSAKAAAKARMPIPPSGTQSRTLGGDLQYSHDEFIRDYMNKNGVSQEQAELAWQERQKVDRALFGNEEEDNGTGTVYGNEGGRDAGLASGGTVSGVQSRNAGSGQPADTGARGRAPGKGPARTGAAQAGAQGERVITKHNAKQRDFVRAAKDAGFNKVTLVNGPIVLRDAEGNPILDKNGKPRTANAVVDTDGNLRIRWDNPYASPLKIMEHEKIHLWLDSLSHEARLTYVRDALLDILGEEKINSILAVYAREYAQAYAGLSEQEFLYAIGEEVLADMYAGLDLYKAGTAEFQNDAEMYVTNTDLQQKFFGDEETTDDSTLPGRLSLNDPFRESTDWDIPADARPFPGEKPMHTQLDRFSVSSMAEGGGFDLEFNDAGLPYALIDRSTGERVTKVTADMMIGTPLGDLVQMAVDNGGIDEAEAKTQRQMLADAMNMIVKYNDAAVVWELAGSQLFSAIKSNSDKQYNKTIDFSTICKKTMAIVDAMSETMKRLGRGLTRREVEAVYYETGNAGEATPCPVCYVFSRWMGIGNLLDQMSRFQDVYAGKSEEELVKFMEDVEARAKAYAEAASKSKQEDFYDKNGNLKIGKVISDMKTKPNNQAASAIRKLNQHHQANIAISELQGMISQATPEQAARWKNLIKTLKRNVLKESQIQELQAEMAQADSEVEVFEVYQWLAKTVMKSDSQVDENGDAIGNWKKNPDFKPVPKDILFDLNRGGDFAKDYPLSWAFRTGKGCAMGKAITPYADARVGETIQGVALSDVKAIRVGAEVNEFLNGDVKKQKKTLESARKKQKQQNLIGGMRYQSTSDFRYEFGSDYLMTFFEMQALGANVQLYTKVIEAVDFLASTGADCNLSVMPLGDGYVIDPETGEKKLVFSNVTGINAEAAIKKSKQYDNVQLILVGINDENIRLALEGTDVTFVIPFHGSGQSVHQVQTLMDLLGEHLDVTQAQDYTSVQSDHVSPNQTAEQKAMWDLRMAIIMGKCEDGLTSEQQALLAKNRHLQKLYDMFYVDETAPAYHNYLGKDQAEHIFPYEYWDREGDYEHADENGRTFQEYCASMGIIPRFSGINSKGEAVGFGDFTKVKGYWKLLIDRSMYENVYDENGEWIGYGRYRDQQQINMSNVKLSDLDPKTGEAQFTNGEMSKQYDATHSETDRQNLDTIVTRSIQRIEAMRDKGDVFDRTQVTDTFRKNIMEADSAIRERASLAPGEENTIYIKDGHLENGETINFIDAILDGRKKGETRSHKSLTRNWVGLGKDGMVYGRARFGEPQILEKGTQEYYDSMIEGTEYDLKDGETKYYYPVLEVEDFRDNPKPITRNGNYGQYQRFDRSNPEYRYSLSLSDPGFESSEKEAPVTDERGQVLYVAPSSDAWAVARDSDGSLLNTKYIQDELGLPIYDNPQDEYKPEKRGVIPKADEAAHKTANKSTAPTYAQAFDYLMRTGKEGARVLDASSGKGHGVEYGRSLKTEDGRQMFDVTDLELFPGGRPVDFQHYGGLIAAIEAGEEEPFDFIISNAVINVMAQDAREELLGNMLRMLKPGGELFINPAFPKEWDGYKKAIPLEEYKRRAANGENLSKMNVILAPSGKNTGGEIYTAQSKSIQKGYTDPEFMAFAQDVARQTLGEDIKIVEGKKLPGLNKGFVITRSTEAQPRSRYSVSPELTEAQQKNANFNEKQTEVGSPLKTLQGTTIKRYKGIAGKEVAPQVYVHKNYADQVIPVDVLSSAESVLQEKYPDFNYNTVMYDKKTGAVRFDEAPDFDTAREPIAGNTVTVFPDGRTKTGYSDSIWHHKWLWVGNDYDGFNVEDSWNWSKQWLNTIRPVDPSEHKFNSSFSQRGIANGTGHGTTNWNEQLDYFGLPHDENASTEAPQERYSATPEDTDGKGKKNPYKEGSLENMVFDILSKASSPQELQDKLNELRQQQADNQANRYKPPVIPSKDKARPVNKEQRKIQENQLAKLIEKYGAIKKGEKAARDISLPEKVSDTRDTRQFTRTAAEAEGIPQRFAERIGGELLTSDLLSYVAITDDAAISSAKREFDQLGYKKAIDAWATKSATNHIPTKYDMAFGAKLLVESARQGDDITAMRVLADLSAMETQAGQVVQAARLLKKLGPSGQLYYVQKAVDRLNHQNEGRIAKGKMDPIVIDQDLAKAVMLAETKEDMDKAMDALIEDIAGKLPITLKDRWDAWRYLSMLGNPRTHVRNFFGNVFFMPARFMKDVLAAGGEKMFIKDQSQRTKDLKALMRRPEYKATREFALADFEVMRDQIVGTGKLNPINEIVDRRKVLPGKLLNKISEKNDEFLTKEDVWAMRKAYVSALTQFIAARGLDLETLSATPEGDEILNEARRYAVIEAQKATYRDFSLAAMKLNQLKRGGGFASWLIDGILPFTKTPINILKRGFEYSPAGLIKSLTYDLNRMRNGDISAAEAIDHVAAGMTGTGIAVLGWLLASIGMAHGGADKDDKKDDMEKAQGHQNYSLEYGGLSYTIDWMAPVALPFFLGVQAYEELSDGTEGSFYDFVNAMTMIAEPMTSLSMLDGINSTLAAVRRGGETSPIQSIITNALASYVSQGAPTVFGQVARTFDPDRRATYVDKNSEVSPFIQRFVQQVQGKIPGAENQKMAYIDVWGRKDTNQSMFLRALENFISPGYLNRVNETVVDSELLRLADATGNSSVLPAEAAKYFQVEGNTLNLTAKQYERYKTVTGKTAFKLLGDLFSGPVYAAMDDAQKAAAVEQALKISTAIGKQDVAPTYKTDGWIQRAIDHGNLENASMFHMLKGLESGLSNYQLISAMNWLTNEEKGELIMSEHPNTQRNMTDYTRKGYKFVLTDEQIAREREIYEGLFWKAYTELISSSKYRRASVAKQAEMIKKMQSDLGAKARKKLGKELRSAGFKSVKLDDSDVPEEVANLYDLLNR